MAAIAQWIHDYGSVALRRAYDDLDTSAVLDADRFFPAHTALERLYPQLRAEALAVFEANPAVPRFHDISSTQYRISDNDGKNWRMFLVKSYGREISANAALVPTLAGFLRAHPEVTTAAISYLDPGKHIPPHRGPFRGILRYHLCLFAPDAASNEGPWLKVDEQRQPYREGGALLWDDTYVHEVLNPGPNPRIALLLDVRRPVKRPLHRVLFGFMMAAGWIYTRFNEKHMRAAPATK